MEAIKYQEEYTLFHSFHVASLNLLEAVALSKSNFFDLKSLLSVIGISPAAYCSELYVFRIEVYNSD
jgi:hypothetical protein